MGAMTEALAQLAKSENFALRIEHNVDLLLRPLVSHVTFRNLDVQGDWLRRTFTSDISVLGEVRSSCSNLAVASRIPYGAH
jgi:hypothetical protein